MNGSFRVGSSPENVTVRDVPVVEEQGVQCR